MKLISEPTVYLIAKQSLQYREMSRFLADHHFENWTTDSPSDAQTLVEICARNCYQSFNGGRPHTEHIAHLIDVGHGSTLEAAVFTLMVVGVSRSLSHELIRHRQLSPGQLSQRYVDESVAEYVVPPDLTEEVNRGRQAWYSTFSKPDFSVDEYLILQEKRKRGFLTESEFVGVEWLFSVGVTQRAYGVLSDFQTKKAAATGLVKTEARKFARQSARSVLPNATETKLFLTANARALRNVIEQRCSRHADPEIRVLAGRIWETLKPVAPDLFGDYTRVELSDGTFELKTAHPKV